jgi:hypothetical protein
MFLGVSTEKNMVRPLVGSGPALPQGTPCDGRTVLVGPDKVGRGLPRVNGVLRDEPVSEGERRKVRRVRSTSTRLRY